MSLIVNAPFWSNECSHEKVNLPTPTPFYSPLGAFFGEKPRYEEVERCLFLLHSEIVAVQNQIDALPAAMCKDVRQIYLKGLSYSFLPLYVKEESFHSENLSHWLPI